MTANWQERRGSQHQERARDWHIELLRLLAIFGIAIFHTFLPFFNSLVSSNPQAVSAASLPESFGWFGAFLLGAINILGAAGNHIFFMLSGFFLIPSATKKAASRKASSALYWCQQLRSTLRRIVIVLAAAAFYAVIALVISTWITPLPGVSVHQTAWLTSGLEFVWLYLIFVIVTPVWGFVCATVPQRIRVVPVIAFVVLAYILNAYIAYVSPGSAVRSLFEWRKLMSGVTYLGSYLLAGVIGEWLSKRNDRVIGTRTQGDRVIKLVCVVVVVVCFAPMLVAAPRNDFDLMNAMTFKSTSVFSFAIALCSLIITGLAKRREGLGVGKENLFMTVVIPWLASGILGFYIAQSVFVGVWQPVVNKWLGQLLGRSDLGGLRVLGECTAFFLVGLAFSVVFVVVVVVFDRVVRRGLLRFAHLA